MTTTKIEWAQAVWNPVVGCSLKSSGCVNCYAMPMAWRLAGMASKPDGTGNVAVDHYSGLTRKSGGRSVWTGKVAAAPDAVWLAPLRRRKPTIYFVNSMGDLFHEVVPDEWIDRAFAVMALCPQHKFIVLTKRATRMRGWAIDPMMPRRVARVIIDMLIAKQIKFDPQTWPVISEGDIDEPSDVLVRRVLPNVALGVSVEDQDSADERIPHLLAIPAAIRLISAEPLLGPVDLNRIHEVFDDGQLHTWESALDGKRFDIWTDFDSDPMLPGFPKLDWVIAGGESGKGSRPCHPDWARGLRDQCAAAGVPFFWKQWGDWFPVDRASDVALLDVIKGSGSFRAFGDFMAAKIGKAKAGALLDGQIHRAAPDGWLA